MLGVEFNRKGLKSPGFGVLLESLGVQSVASLLSSRFCMKNKRFSVLVLGLVFFPPHSGLKPTAVLKILLNGWILKNPTQHLERFALVRRDFLRDREMS